MDGYVIVTLAPNGVVHAYGCSGGTPFPTRSKAQTEIRKMQAHDELMYPGDEPVRYLIRKVLGGQP